MSDTCREKYPVLSADKMVYFGGVSSSQVDQLFSHLSQQLVQVRSSVSDALQSRYDYYTWFPGQLSAQVVDDISRQLTALRAVIAYTEKVL